jgi:hypothetical protein
LTIRPGKAAENAEILGLQALAWLAGEDEALERLLAASGMDQAGLKAAAERPETLGAVLEFLLANEPLLLAFCGESGTDPKDVHSARHVLEAGG